jgi:hypothetical protein
MGQVILFSPSTKEHVDWKITTQQHPYALTLNLSNTTSGRKMAPSQTCVHIDTISISAPHPEIVLMLMRSVQYNKHLEDTFVVCGSHLLCNDSVANAKELLLAMLKHDKLKCHCLEIFKYELWCTQKLHPMLRRMVTFIGPYMHTQEDIESLYKQNDNTTISDPKTIDKNKLYFMNTSLLQEELRLRAVASMYYFNTKQIPRSYNEFAHASNMLFLTMRCVSPLWRSSLKKNDTRTQFDVLQTQIGVLLDEYNSAVENAHN